MDPSEWRVHLQDWVWFTRLQIYIIFVIHVVVSNLIISNIYCFCWNTRFIPSHGIKFCNTLVQLIKSLISSFSKCQQNRAESSLKKVIPKKSTFLFCPLSIAHWYLCRTYLLVSSNTKHAQGADIWLNTVVVIV